MFVGVYIPLYQHMHPPVKCTGAMDLGATRESEPCTTTPAPSNYAGEHLENLAM